MRNKLPIEKRLVRYLYRVVKLDFTPVEVFDVLSNRSLSIFTIYHYCSITPLTQNIKYFNIRCRIQLDLAFLNIFRYFCYI